MNFHKGLYLTESATKRCSFKITVNTKLLSTKSTVRDYLISEIFFFSKKKESKKELP